MRSFFKRSKASKGGKKKKGSTNNYQNYTENDHQNTNDYLISSYQSLPDANPNNFMENSNNVVSKYKGFNTSITHIFTDPSSSRVDCCSLFCCGILQSDYNRYIIHNRRPPTFTYRFVMYILVPVALFCIAGYAAVMVGDPMWRELIVWTLLGFMIAWILGGCFRTTYKHGVARRDLLWKVKGISAGVVVDSYDEIDLEQTSKDIKCSHRICGCYGTDLSDDEIYGGINSNGSSIENGPFQQQTNFLGSLSTIFASLCCGRLFKTHWQICGICAIAQEGRQIDSIVPIDRRRMDYVTFQSYFDYMNELREIRVKKNGNLWDHFMALSKLSRMMMKTFIFVTMLLLTYSLAVAPTGFQWSNMIVFVATFLQAFFILYFVHWHWNRFEISLDAVIKYFACGFIITTSTAIGFELFESVVFNIIFHIITIAIGSVEEQRKEVQQQYPLLGIIFIFCSAYLTAALVEESCKYFGFNMVEHPDLLSEKDFETAVAVGIFDDNVDDNVDDDDYSDTHFEYVGGGFDCDDYENEVDDEESEHDNNQNTPQLSATVNTSAATSCLFDSKLSRDDKENDPQQHQQLQEQEEGKSKTVLYPCPPKTLQSQGVAITVAMVSVSLGFACCENLIYIFLYNRGPLDAEIAVLISRSLFPIHPLCAAIQSIQVCKQKLENDQSLSLGSIIFPSVLLHGTYDFSIMLFGFFSTLSGDNKNQNDIDEADNLISLIYSICAFILSICFVVGGASYYWTESKAQKIRLEQLDSARNFVGI